LQARLDEIHDKGAELVAIGSGGPHFARVFVEDLGVTFPVYSDETRRSYAAFERKRDRLALIRPYVDKNAARATKAGFHQTSVQGDAWQNGGVVVVRPGGELAFVHIENEAGDLADLDAVLAAI